MYLTNLCIITEDDLLWLKNIILAYRSHPKLHIKLHVMIFGKLKISSKLCKQNKKLPHELNHSSQQQKYSEVSDK